MRTLAVVPSYQEEESVGRTVLSLLAIPEVDRVVVIDDSSDDSTPRGAACAGATVVVNGANLGKGGSLNRVLPHLEFDILLLIDGDLGDSAREADKILRPVLAGEADLVVAAFGSPSRKGGFGVAQGLGRKVIRMLAGREMASPLSGQRAMTRRVYGRVAPFERGFGVEVGMTVDALRAGFTVVEVETGMSHRETGRDLAGFIHRGRQFADILRSALRRTPRGGGT